MKKLKEVQSGCTIKEMQHFIDNPSEYVNIPKLVNKRMDAVKANVKAFKGGLTHITKTELAKMYVKDVTWLMRELAKAQKPSV